MSKRRSSRRPPIDPLEELGRPLAARCAAGFERGDRARGEGYFRQRRVGLGRVEDDGVGAKVSGSGIRPYRVRIDWSGASSGAIAAYCECARFASGHLCKHLWATLRAADAARAQDFVPGAAEAVLGESGAALRKLTLEDLEMLLS